MKLTKRLIEALEPGPTGYFAWDDELRRFGVRVLPSGRKTFVIQYRVNRRSRRMTLGKFGIVTPEWARGRALQALAQVEAGEDPLEHRVEKQQAITVRELATRFEITHIDLNPKLKNSTGREYKHALRRYILPALGKLKVGEVTRAHVGRLHLSMSDRPYQANRTVEVVSKIARKTPLERRERNLARSPRKEVIRSFHVPCLFLAVFRDLPACLHFAATRVC